MAKKDYTKELNSSFKPAGIAGILQKTEGNNTTTSYSPSPTAEKKKKSSVLLNLPYDLKRKMDFYCLEHEITKQEFIISLIEKEINRSGRT